MADEEKMLEEKLETEPGKDTKAADFRFVIVTGMSGGGKTQA